MYHTKESSKTNQKEGNVIFPLACPARKRIREDTDLYFLKEDIEAVKIPIEVMRNRIIATVGTFVFFEHEFSLVIFTLFLKSRLVL